ncbi:hypothetical protein EVAR_30068_1 [Eumeta japonica]|uniref:Uncharacterized protein n=1 Tax=Eumeta variegata TaxID=151549 RepID=A0A4C1XBQ4_EUMVA|nr:hypothetical protein EVAR_30068_1 [Eumeta japonica]
MYKDDGKVIPIANIPEALVIVPCLQLEFNHPRIHHSAIPSFRAVGFLAPCFWILPQFIAEMSAHDPRRQSGPGPRLPVNEYQTRAPPAAPCRRHRPDLGALSDNRA